MPQRPPRRPRLVIFDLDGVVYRGLDPVPGAADLINDLHRRRVRVRYATNNSMATREAYVERLASMGVRAAVPEIVTSTSATIGYLRHHLPEAHHVLAVGSQAMIAELRAAGLEVTPVAELSHDFVGHSSGEFSRRELVSIGTMTVFHGRRQIERAGFRQPPRDGQQDHRGCGGEWPKLVAAIRAASGGIEPIIVGKPQPTMFAEILEDARVKPEAAVVVGDNPDADIVAGHRSGIFTVLILTGVADAALADELAGERKPDLVVADHSELARQFDEWLS